VGDANKFPGAFAIIPGANRRRKPERHSYNGRLADNPQDSVWNYTCIFTRLLETSSAMRASPPWCR